jgi:antibiotic biosynthesis monooxygenase (ABM) superfamily enzyme
MSQSEKDVQVPITLVISEVVRVDRLEEYEVWVKGLFQLIEKFDGFIGVDVLRPADHKHPEYVIIIIFDSYDHLKKCQESPTYVAWMEKSTDLIVGEAAIQKASGLETWFTLPDESRFMPQPAFYKMVIVGTIAVFSLVLAVDAIFGFLLRYLPPLLDLFVSITIVSVFMTYPVMPYLTRWLDFWLYPSPAKKG